VIKILGGKIDYQNSEPSHSQRVGPPITEEVERILRLRISTSFLPKMLRSVISQNTFNFFHDPSQESGLLKQKNNRVTFVLKKVRYRNRFLGMSTDFLTSESIP